MTISIRWPPERPALEPCAGGEALDDVTSVDDSASPAGAEFFSIMLPAGEIDYPDSGSTVPRSVLAVQGWAMFPTGPPDRVEITLDGKQLGRARLCCAREDIRLATGIEAAGVSGFSFYVELWGIDESVERAVIGARAFGPEGESLPLAPVDVWLSPPDSPRARPGLAAARLRPAAPRQPKDIELLVVTGQPGSDSAVPSLVQLLSQVAKARDVGGVVLSTVDSPDLARLEDAGFDVHLTGPFPVDSPALYEARLEELAAWVTRQHFDAALIDTFDAFPGGDLATRLGLPAVWAINESIPLRSHWEVLRPDADPFVRRRAEMALQAGAAAVFGADATRELYAPDLPGVPCVTVPHGVDVEALERGQRSIDRDQARARRDIPSDATVVLCAGAFSPPEEQAALVWAFARVADRHPDAVLVLVDELGETSAAAALALSACGLGEDRVRLEPLLELPEAYAISDLLVCALDWRWLPCSILEAMAVGLPVLGTAMLGIPELIEDGVTGWLCEPGDVGALARALGDVLTLDASERVSVARTASARVRSEYDSSVSARAWAYLLTRVAARRPIQLPSLASLTRRHQAWA